MFNFLKKGKYYKPDTTILEKVLLCLPEKYNDLLKQVTHGLIKGVFYQSSPIKNYVGFSYDALRSKEFENRKGRSFVLKGIKVVNKIDNKSTNFDIYVANGLIAGYSTSQVLNFAADEQSINCDNLYREYLEDFSYVELAKIFTESQLKIINPSEVYELELEGKIYYHLQDLEDGDFIAMGKNGEICKVTHDPFEVVVINEELSKVLK